MNILGLLPRIAGYVPDCSPGLYCRLRPSLLKTSHDRIMKWEASKSPKWRKSNRKQDGYERGMCCNKLVSEKFQENQFIDNTENHQTAHKLGYLNGCRELYPKRKENIDMIEYFLGRFH